MASCPFCAKRIGKRAIKCPFCHMIVATEKNQFKSMWKNLIGHVSSPFNLLFLLVCVFFPLPVFYLLHLGKIGWIISFLIFLCFIRPFQSRPEVLILLGTLIFAGSGFFIQKSDFEFRSRPYIRIHDDALKIDQVGRYRVVGDRLEPQFILDYGFSDHGSVPASITKIAAYGFNFEEKSLRENLRQMNPDEIDQINQWINLDIFPGPSPEIRRKSFYWNVSDVQAVLGVTLDENEMPKKVADPKDPVSPYLLEQFRDGIPRFKLLMYLEYFALEEQHNARKRPYKYWAIFNYDGQRFQYYRSGTGDLKTLC